MNTKLAVSLAALLALSACGAGAWLWPKAPAPGLGVVRFFLALPEGTQP